MAKDSTKGLVLGFVGGLVGGVAVSIAIQNFLMEELSGNMHGILEAADYDDIALDMAIIKMAEKGETERIVATYCNMLRTRMDYIRPANIKDPELRSLVEKRRAEAIKLIARLEAEEKCLTKR